MADSHIQNMLNMTVIQRIKNGFAVSSRFDQLGAFQNAELMGNCGLCQPQEACDIANAKFSFAKCVKNTDSGGISEYFEEFGKMKKSFFFGHFAEYLLYDIFVNAEKFAFFNRLFCIHIDLLPI